MTKLTAIKSTKSKQIWEDIKDKTLDVFATPAKVSDFCEYLEIDPQKCYLTSTASAVLPALEAALGANYVCNVADRYIVVEAVDANERV